MSPDKFVLIFSLFLPRCGSVVVDLALKFSSTVRESEVLFILRDAANSGGFGDLNVSAILGTRDLRTPATMATTPTSPSDSMCPQHIINILSREFVKVM